MLRSSVQARTQTPAAQQPQVLVEDVEIRGNRRIPADTIRLYVQTKKGDVFDRRVLEKDLKAINAQGFFQDVKVLEEDGPGGGKVVIFQVTERPVIRDIVYVGLKSVLESEVLDEFRKRRVKLTKESLFDPVQVNLAKRVIIGMLGEKGKPDATVDVEVDEISVTTVAIVFNVDEGPRVRVMSIDFEGNTHFSDKQLRRQLKLTKQSSLFTLFSSKDVYSKEKLANDIERLKYFLGTKGYWHPIISEPKIEEAGEIGSWIPVIGKKGRGLKITIPIEEGKVYRIGKVEISGNTLFTKEQIMQVTGFVPGEIANADTIRKGVTENLKKLYGQVGYVQFNPDIQQDLVDTPGSNEGTVNFTIDIEEGRPFTLHFLNFIGNHFTRDNVLRREVLINEGEPFNQTLWELSILRLNQLGYFNEIKDESANFRFNERDNTMDIDLKVQEKGRQSISFSGGASGFGGSFIGINYSTNNFLGFGEQLGFAISAGNRQSIYSFSFTEPYVKGKPMSLGFSITKQKLQYLGGLFGATDAFSGSFFGGLGVNNDELFTQFSTSASVSISAPMSLFIKRWRFGQFARLGLSYSYQKTRIEQPKVNKDFDPNNNILIPFEQPNTTLSTLSPTFTMSTLQGPQLDPTGGNSLLLALNITGGILGGQVNFLQPVVEWKQFLPGHFKIGDKETTFAYRVRAGHVMPFGARFNSNSLFFVDGVPIFSRYYLGGEFDIRGYNIRSISPLVSLDTFLKTKHVKAVIPNSGQLRPVLPNDSNRFDGSQIAQSVIDHFKFTGQDGKNPFRSGSIDQPLGGNTELLINAEYRIPIAGPLTIACFADVGSAFNMGRLREQIITSNFLPQVLTPATPTPFGFFPGVITNPYGLKANRRQMKAAIVPELGFNGLPPGFLSTIISADTQSISVVNPGNTTRSGILDNYRASMGAEFRVQVPVINVPFRLIFAYNPNAKPGFIPGTFLEERKKVIRFSIGRTF